MKKKQYLCSGFCNSTLILTKYHTRMKRYYLLAALFAACSLGFISCDKDEINNDKKSSQYDAGNKVEDHVLTAEESKNKLMGVAQMMASKFNPSDQREAIDLADNLADKYQSYDWNDVENHFEDRYSSLFSAPRYIADVAAGRQSPAAILANSYVFSFANDKAIFEANDRTRTWEYKGIPAEDCLILRCKDGNGQLCEAKCWGSGQTKEVSYSYDVKDDYGNRTTKTVTGLVPEKIIFTLNAGGTEHIRMEIYQNIDFESCKRIQLDFSVRVSNLSWAVNTNITQTSGSMGIEFKYGQESLISMLVNLPSYQLHGKTTRETYEDWAQYYEEHYDELISQIGNANAIVDLMGWVQLKMNLTNIGSAYEQAKNLDEYGFFTENRADAEKMVKLINRHQENGLYYGSNLKQAEVVAQVARETRYRYDYDYYTGQYREYTVNEYYPEGVLYFPQDGTTYAFDEYFTHAPFTDLQKTAEVIANLYIKASDLLIDATGGEIHFTDEEYY